MNWLTLTFGEVAAFSAVAGAIALWLYLRQPRPLRLIVTTLRFWESAPTGSADKRRLKLPEPLPFLAQLLFLIALIAAFGNPQRGAAVAQRRSVAMVVDASAWSQLQPQGGPSWLSQIQREASDALAQLTPGDRVALLRADADGAPVVSFTTDRGAIQGAINHLQSSSAVPDVPRALAQGLAGLGDSPSGLLVYIGPGIMDAKQLKEIDEFRHLLAGQSGPGRMQFLTRLVGESTGLANRGITRLALKRREDRSNQWSLLVEIENYEAVPANVILNLAVNGQVFHREPVSIAGNGTASVTDDFTSPNGGVLQATITPTDELVADNSASIDLPSSQPVSVAVLTGRDGFITKLRMVLSSNPYVRADFMVPGTNPSADVIIYDGAVPANAPPSNSISLLPNTQTAALRRVRLGNWNAEHPVTRWIQSRDVSVRAGRPLEVQKRDTVLASSTGESGEPLILARENNGYRSVILGFDPLDSNFTMEPAFPLLIAASIEWMTRPVEDRVEGLSAGTIDLPIFLTSIVSPSGRDVPFARANTGVHFFAANDGDYRLAGPGGTTTLMVNVPDLPTGRWKPTAGEQAVIEGEPALAAQHDLWRWLTGVALVALWLEWLLFFFSRGGGSRESPSRSKSARFEQTRTPSDSSMDDAGRSVLKSS